MLSKTILDKLNAQINLEYYSANLYLQMSSWCLSQSLDGCAFFLRQHSNEEKGHGQQLFDYVNETGSMSLIGEIKAPKAEYESVPEIFQATYEHECFITKEINQLASAAFKEGDFSTFNFLQWYVAEQHEEEHLFKSILERIKMINTDGKGLFFIDKEIRRIAETRGSK